MHLDSLFGHLVLTLHQRPQIKIPLLAQLGALGPSLLVPVPPLPIADAKYLIKTQH